MSSTPDGTTDAEPQTLGQAILKSKTTSESTKILPTSLFVQHLATYPAVAAIVGLIASSPPVKILISNAIPLAQAISERSKPVTEPVVKRATPYAEKVDKMCDSVLTKVVDNNFPILKTAQPKDLVEIAVKPVGDAKAAVSQRVSQTVVAPLKSASNKARAQYSKIYDTQGKALIRSRVDPLVLPVNERLQAAIVEYLPAEPNSEAVLPQSKDVSNEVSRTFKLAKTAYDRAKPSINSQLVVVKSIPKQANDHFQSVLQEKKASKSVEGSDITLYSSILAYLDTGRQLTEESRKALIDSLQGPKDTLLAPVKSLYKNVEEAEEEAKVRVQKASVYIQSFLPGRAEIQANGSE